MVKATSSAVNGLPSCHFTLSRRVNDQVRPSALLDHSVASQGMIFSESFQTSVSKDRLMSTQPGPRTNAYGDG